MSVCPITYDEIPDGTRYSPKGLRLLSSKLSGLKDLPLTADEQRREAIARATKMSVQGVQAKLSAILNVRESIFEIVDRNGKYILKPQSHLYPQLPENEDLTMRLAKTINLEVPQHGLIYCRDKSMTYFIKRFDRLSKGKKLAVEDFAQLAGQTRDTKYDWSMEKLLPIINNKCTFPAVERLKLLKLTLFNFLIGNEDMHLKNFSLISRDDKVELSPCYDLINTTIALPNAKEELALPLRGKKANMKLRDFRDYYAIEKMEIPAKVFDETVSHIKSQMGDWSSLIEKSFLSAALKKKYHALLEERAHTLLFADAK